MGAIGGRSPGGSKQVRKKSKVPSASQAKARKASSPASPKQAVKGQKGCGIVQAHSRLRRRRMLVAAKGLINGSAQDPGLWSAMLAQPAVAEFLRRSLIAKASRDDVFAQMVAWTAPRGFWAIMDREAFADGPPPPLAWPSQRAPQLTAREEESSSSLPEASPKPLLKRRRRLSGKQLPAAGSAWIDIAARSSSSSASPMLSQANQALKQLPADLAATVMSFVDVRSKVVNVSRVSPRLRQAMQSRVAWDPLQLDQVTGRAVLRLLKQKDPLGCFTADVNRTKALFPKGFFDVRQLETVLMDPEKVEPVQSDTEDESPKPRPLLIPDPLDEVCKRLRHYFTRVAALTITNIEDYRMDYRFVSLRSGSLEGFGFVELKHRDSHPPTYELRALRDVAPQLIDLRAVEVENRSRIPSSVKVEEQTTISEREALYLREHLSAYKNGDDFHLVHAFYRTVRSHAVRKRYKAIVVSLRRRFPTQFPVRQGPGSPDGPRS